MKPSEAYVLLIDKDAGPTSHDVVAAARRALRTKKIGHSGTLDPFATGLLVLCVGGATRLAEYLSGLDKGYEAVARLGARTDTDDLDGEIVAGNDAWRQVTAEDIRSALAGFEGTQDQVPPQFSAKKVDGVAMHRRARAGDRVELEPCRVTVHAIELVEVSPPDVRFTVRCSSGTYIRSIARDLGEQLGCGAHLVELRRSAVGRFTVQDAVSVRDLEGGGPLGAARIEPLDALAHLDELPVSAEAARRLGHGQKVPVRDAVDEAESPSAVDRVVRVSCAGRLVAVARVEAGVLHPAKVFAGA